MAGALCFFASGLVAARSPSASVVPDASHRVVVDATRISGLRRDFRLTNRSSPTERETRVLVDNLVDEEILFREAIAMGFEKADRSIGWRLVQKMRYLGEDHGDDVTTLYRRALAMGLASSDPVVRRILVEKMRLIIGHTGPKPTDAEIAEWYAAHQSEYGQAARITFRHVFFDRTRRGVDGAREAADQASAEAAGRGAAAAASMHGDPFVMGNELPAQGPNDLAKLFGPKFGDEALSLPEHKWSSPIESTYGWHVVWVEKKLDPRIPALAEVRSRVEKSLEASLRERKVGDYLARVRPTYAIEIDESAIRGQNDG